MRNLFRLETERTISNDWVVRYENRLLQVERQNRNWAPARAKVMVCEWQDGSIDIHYGERKLSWREIEARAAKPAMQRPAKAVTHRKPEPATDHPWRKSYQTMLASKAANKSAVVRVAASASP